jgi:hypothetical protein
MRVNKSTLLSSSEINRFLYFAIPNGIRFPLFIFIGVIIFYYDKNLNFDKLFSLPFILVEFIYFALFTFCYFEIEGKYSKIYKTSNNYYLIDHIKFHKDNIISIKNGFEYVNHGRISFNYPYLVLSIKLDNDKIEGKPIEYSFKIVPKHNILNLITLGFSQKRLNSKKAKKKYSTNVEKYLI